MPSIPGAPSASKFDRKVVGSYGRFAGTGLNRIDYLVTKISARELDTLSLAMEFLDRDRMNVDELMQREIDHERVKTEILPYLQRSNLDGFRYFPPLVVALLTTDEGVVTKLYPDCKEAVGEFGQAVPDPADGAHYRHRTFGDAFRVSIPVSSDETDLAETSSLSYAAKLSFNSDVVRLLVIDGQHRLIALRAIFGKITKKVLEDWRYDAAALAKLKAEMNFESIPVAVVFAPNAHQGNPAAHAVQEVGIYRQIFVDINKEAKPVSPATNILLSEVDLIHRFTRSVFSKFAALTDYHGQAVPLYLTDWSPALGKSHQLSAGRTLTSVGIVDNFLEVLLSVPAQRVGTRDEKLFRQRMSIFDGRLELTPAHVQQPGVQPSELSPTSFAAWQRDILLKQFDDEIRPLVLEMYSEFEPFKRHIERFEEFRKQATDDFTADPTNYVAQHRREYLVGSPADRKLLELQSSSSEDSRKAIEACRAFFSEVEQERRERGSGIFFSQLGQVSLARVIVRLTVGDRVKDAFRHVLDRLKASAQRIVDLLHSDRPWNAPIATLGTTSDRFKHVEGLLLLALLNDEVVATRLGETASAKLRTEAVAAIKTSVAKQASRDSMTDKSVADLPTASARKQMAKALGEQRAGEYITQLMQHLGMPQPDPVEVETAAIEQDEADASAEDE